VATYAFGDIHGCFKTFMALLRKIDFDPKSDFLWLVGDLVNRGPRNLETLIWVYEHDAQVTAVLGNHDLHLIRRHLGLSAPKVSETFDDVLLASDRDRLVEWLRRRPLIHQSGRYVLVHAGILPSWKLKTASRFAVKAEKQLQKDPTPLFNKLQPTLVSDHGRKDLTTRQIARILTRVRCCSSPEEADLEYAGPPEDAPPSIKPWFTFPEIVKLDKVFVFGHWAQMKCRITPQAWALDSGCVYGGPLSAIRLDDGRLFQQVNLED